VACRAAAPLDRGPDHGIARRGRHVQDRYPAPQLVQAEHFGIDAVEPHGVAALLHGLHVVLGREQRDQPALAEHEVVVELAGQPLPELERVLVEEGAFVPEVVGAHHGGVAPRVAAAEPALLEHRDPGDAVVLGQVICGRQAVAAAADDDHVVLGPRLRAAPGRLPVLVMAERVARQAEDRIALHPNPPCAPRPHGTGFRRQPVSHGRLSGFDQENGAQDQGSAARHRGSDLRLAFPCLSPFRAFNPM
jgi:hypothetical protein